MVKKSPSYRTRKDTTQAIVTLTDAVTRKRRDYWLGEYGSPESRELYHQLLAEWEANGKRLPAPPNDGQGPEALDEPIVLPQDNLRAFKNRIAFKGVEPGPIEHRGRFAVLLEPLKAGSIGSALVSGVTAARIYIKDADQRPRTHYYQMLQALPLRHASLSIIPAAPPPP